MSDFWTRRRARVNDETRQIEAEAIAATEAQAQAALADRQATMTEPELLAELGLPDPDSLKSGDDFTAFLRREVPEFLRRRALRRLWGSNPVLANLDGLLDHGEDYTDSATVKAGMRSSYQVGQGMVNRVLDQAEAMLASAEETGAGAQPAPEPAFQPAPNPVRKPTSARVTVLPPSQPITVAAAEPEPPATALHMQFRFDETHP